MLMQTVFALQEPAEQPLRENELLTFWGKPPYKPLAKQLEDESNLYEIPSMRPGKFVNLFSKWGSS